MMLMLLLAQLLPSLLHTNFTLFLSEHVVYQLDYHQSLLQKLIAAAIPMDWLM